ncbi:SDR family oxidoreductase [Pasteuria penetrans]|uniref:SDR family oxidoreductase n=1 Tax=Pasteuria penetrans TaxID=86005 RepID=UPI000F970671|nr:SDR family NAD(P)-dependent oxidoreductase [Pasteuria penetrans]
MQDSGVWAWVDGGSGAIGGKVAEILAQRGLNVVVTYHRGVERAHRVVERCLRWGVKALSVPISSVGWKAGEILVPFPYTVEPGVYVHAAGGTIVGVCQELGEQDWKKLFHVHVEMSFRAIRTFLPSMIRNQWGRIVLVTSIFSAASGGALETLYTAVKGAQEGFVRSLAQEVAAAGVTVNAVAPGAIDTPLLQRQLSPVDRDALREAIPMRRLGTPAEVAHLVGFLCSEEAAYITGQVIGISGGFRG